MVETVSHFYNIVENVHNNLTLDFLNLQAANAQGKDTKVPDSTPSCKHLNYHFVGYFIIDDNFRYSLYLIC